LAAAKCNNALDVCPLVLICSDQFFVCSGEEVVAEGTPPERQVSPNKLLRAALLRGRFADTILKAQEKTLLVDKVGLSKLCVSVELRWSEKCRSYRVLGYDVTLFLCNG
jgi:hypothetical protein